MTSKQLCWNCAKVHKCDKYLYNKYVTEFCVQFEKSEYVDNDKPLSLKNFCRLEKLNYGTCLRWVRISNDYAINKLYEATGKKFDIGYHARQYVITEVANGY